MLEPTALGGVAAVGSAVAMRRLGLCVVIESWGRAVEISTVPAETVNTLSLP